MSKGTGSKAWAEIATSAWNDEAITADRLYGHPTICSVGAALNHR
jgi:hypothetical protein